MPALATTRHSPALWATAVVAIGLHVGIVAALPHAARPHVAFSAPTVAAAAVDLVPHAPAAQFQAFAPAAPPPAKVEAPKVKAIATPVRAVASAAPSAKKDEILDMRPQDDNEPVRIATPLPVTVVEPPVDAR